MKKESPVLPLRKSKRLTNLNVDFSENSLFQKAMKDVESQNEINYSFPLPSEMTFSAVLNSGELYENYIKDINIQEPKSTGKHISYDRSILQNLTLDDSNIANIVPEKITALAWYPSADHLILASGSSKGNIGIWNVESESSPHLFKIHNEGTTNMQFNPYNPIQLFSSSYEGTLRCGDLVKQMFSEVYNVSRETSCTYFDFISSETYLVALKNGRVALLDRRKTKPCQRRHVCHSNSVKSVNVHPVNKYFFVTADNIGSVRLWDLRKWKRPVAYIKHHRRCVNSAFFSPITGNSILTTSHDDSICIFDSTNLTNNIRVIRQMKHNISTVKSFRSTYRATWLPNSDRFFALGNVQDYPRRIQVFDKDMSVHHLDLMHDNLTAITSINIFHPFRPALAGSSSGRVFVFT